MSSQRSSKHTDKTTCIQILICWKYHSCTTISGRNSQLRSCARENGLWCPTGQKTKLFRRKDLLDNEVLIIFAHELYSLNPRVLISVLILCHVAATFASKFRIG